MGDISKVGLTDNNPLHIAIIIDGGEREAVVSSDGGNSWHAAKQADLPAILSPLPRTGKIQYVRVSQTASSSPAEQILLRSDDSGQTWIDVSPWTYLRSLLQIDIDARKARFLAKYGKWLPNDETWPLVYAGTGLAWSLAGAILLFRRRQNWLAPMLQSLAVLFFVGLALFAVQKFYANLFLWSQWNYVSGVGLQHPLWPMDLFQQLFGNSWLVPFSALLCFPLTPLYHPLTNLLANTRQQKLLKGIGYIASTALIGLLLLAVFDGRANY